MVTKLKAVFPALWALFWLGCFMGGFLITATVCVIGLNDQDPIVMAPLVFISLPLLLLAGAWRVAGWCIDTIMEVLNRE